ncbi:FAD:protein FMN transferase [Neisseria sp. N95_16]|uniref:FAD:protein FMN transferase n=1 Tax=Neisseria brasiliensis TaxID=2666100 RepID=A0A5Q3RYV8_9NEIS|nr:MULTISPECIES: FAD:protein FMN transferase [Neisseria]MRN37446.1 FAD:protein FMN transferase [Neisseria brasiliensis]PJO08911.1 FAD:protein FMN transferase [Neisseria sp. N95_16]PJO77239.1 FAD:protein FMN transferase [Neisseria sp. N177_16]QGL24443.1 FAD:protein FMN transferase [Neisseria brasiliensis]
MNIPLNRRRFLAISAIVAGGAILPFALNRPTDKPNPDEAEPFVWQGIALGSGAQLHLYHVDRRQADDLVNKALAEVARLEKIFSLYRDDSLIVQLNREGRLNNPPQDLLALLSISQEVYRLTQGAFDPSIQPLWNFYADYFRRHPNTDTPPSQADMNRALQQVGFDKVEFDDTFVRFHGRDMGLSFNGIAQGYITDKVVKLLQQNGVEQALVDMGEIRGLDTRGERTWQVGIRDPQNEQGVLMNVPLQNQGFATSGGYGTVMDEAGKFTHLFDPRSGVSTPRYHSMSVMAPTATLADAFATAFSVMSPDEIRQAARAKQAKVWLVMPDRQMKVIE